MLGMKTLRAGEPAMPGVSKARVRSAPDHRRLTFWASHAPAGHRRALVGFISALGADALRGRVAPPLVSLHGWNIGHVANRPSITLVDDKYMGGLPLENEAERPFFDAHASSLCAGPDKPCLLQYPNRCGKVREGGGADADDPRELEDGGE